MSKHFASKDALLDIILEVRRDFLEPNDAVKRIFKLLLSLHGSVGLIEGALVYNPDRLSYLSYVEKSSSVITMSDGNAEPLSRSMRMAILEEQQEWEMRVGEQICSQVNNSLLDVKKVAREAFLKNMVNGESRNAILRSLHISKRTYYQYVKECSGHIKREFNLTSRIREEMYQKEIKKYIDSLQDSKLKKLCQEQQQVYFDKIKWEKEL